MLRFYIKGVINGVGMEEGPDVWLRNVLKSRWTPQLLQLVAAFETTNSCGRFGGVSGDNAALLADIDYTVECFSRLFEQRVAHKRTPYEQGVLSLQLIDWIELLSSEVLTSKYTYFFLRDCIFATEEGDEKELPPAWDDE